MRRIACLLCLGLTLLAQDEGEKEAQDAGLGALGGMLGGEGEEAPRPIDFAKVDRRIGRLPALTSKAPRYGLFLFGTQGEKRVWAVVDGDVLYLDRNADGDLTGATERIAGEGRSFKIGDFVDPATGAVHKAFTITLTDDSVRYTILWRGNAVTFGSYGPEPGSYATLAASPETAPVFVLGTDRPFEFEHWMSGTLARDAVTDFKVYVGHRGSTRGAFTTVKDTFLPPEEYLQAELHYTDAGGKKQRTMVKLKERC